MSEGLGERLHEALVRFDRAGSFVEADYSVLRRALTFVAVGRGASLDLLDGLINLFFERHVLDDVRRRELIGLSGTELLRAIRHRFRQVIADDREDAQPWHALRAHVRDLLPQLKEGPEPEASWPASLRHGGRFDRERIRQAVEALQREEGRLGPVNAIVGELLRRYTDAEVTAITEAHEVPESIRRRLDGQRLAAGILKLLEPQERSLLQHVLDEGTVESWAAANGCSRATAFRLMARLKTLCRMEFAQRSSGTQLEALKALGAA